MILANNTRIRAEAALHADCPVCLQPIKWTHKPGPVTEWRAHHDTCNRTFALITETVLTMVMDEHGSEVHEQPTAVVAGS
jgi:hypothetical protein